MSRNYYATSQSFFMNENKVRQIIQQQLQEFFIGIKDQIQYKIKQIDHNISTIKIEMAQIQKQQMNQQCMGQQEKTKSIKDVKQLINMIEQISRQKNMQIQNLRSEIFNIFKQNERRQDKSPLFKKTKTLSSVDLNNVIFGEQSIKIGTSFAQQQKNHQQTKTVISNKPPLPKIRQQTKVNKKTNSQQIYQINKQVPKINQNSSKHIDDRQTYLNNKISVQNQQQGPLIVKQTTLLNSGRQNCNINSNKYNEEQNAQTNDGEQKQQVNQIQMRITENLNKNKICFMRKKSLKKFGTIPQQQLQQSVTST